MSNLRCIGLYMPLLFITALPAYAADSHIMVEHDDPVVIDSSLSLTKLVDITLEKHPDSSWLQSLEDEAQALQKRGSSWTAGASQVNLRYQEMTSGTVHYLDAGVQVPLWNLGQRDAERHVAEQAGISAQSQTAVTKLRVAGLVRAALWDMELQKIRYEQTHVDLRVYRILVRSAAVSLAQLVTRVVAFCRR